jgi:hypothetical protein
MGVQLAESESLDPDLGESSTSQALDGTDDDIEREQPQFNFGPDDNSLSEFIFDSYSTDPDGLIPFYYDNLAMGDSSMEEWVFTRLHESDPPDGDQSQ